MKTGWCAALLALALGACTGDPAPSPPPSSAQAAVQEEVVPAGFYRKPKDGEVCKKLDAAPLKALLPGITPGPAMGVYQGRLKCEFSTNTHSPVSIAVVAEMFDSTEAARRSSTSSPRS